MLVKGRMILSPSVSARVENGALMIRVDDKETPAFWMELEFEPEEMKSLISLQELQGSGGRDGVVKLEPIHQVETEEGGVSSDLG
jgi:hypothetical protein